MKLLTAYNPANQIRYCRDLQRCFLGHAPTIGSVAEAYGQETAESWLEIQLNDLSEFAGCKEKLTEAKRTEIAAMIFEDYPHFKLTEFMLFFHKFKKGEYGRFYGAVDPMIILNAVKDFNAERNQVHARRERQLEKERQAAAEMEAESLKARYLQRVPDADTDNAPLSFLQYRMMGYDSMDDQTLTAEINAIISGEKQIPSRVNEMLALIYNSQST